MNRSPGWAEEDSQGRGPGDMQRNLNTKDSQQVTGATLERPEAKIQRQLLGLPIRGSWCQREVLSEMKEAEARLRTWKGP